MAVLWLIVAVALAVFWPGLGGGFLFDDYPNLVHATGWRIALDDPSGWQTLFASDISGALGRPLALASFALNHAFTGLSPFWLKATTLALHVLNGLLLWRLCTGVFADLPATVPRPGPWVAAAVALAWMVHPAQVSTVLYAVQRMEVGATTGVLLALLAYRRARLAQLAGMRAWPWLLAALGALLFGLGFKESALVAPALALLLELCVFRFASREGSSRAWRIAWASACIAGVAGFLLAAWHYAGADAWQLRDYGMGERLLTQPRVLLLYLGQLLLPLPDAYPFYYDHLLPSRAWMSPVSTLWAAMTLAALGMSALLLRQRSPLATLGIGWFFAAHAMTATVVPLELAFEHRNYLALAGVLLALVPVWQLLAARLGARIRIALAVGACAGLALLCAIQAATWGDPMRLALALEQRNPASARAAYGLGTALFDASGGNPSNPRWSQADAQFQRAAALPRANALPLQALLVMHGRVGRAVPPGTWARFRQVLAARPLDADAAGALHAVSTCAVQRRCVFDDRELLQTFLTVLARHPRQAIVYTLYANFAWNRLGDRELAIRLQRTAVALSGDDPLARIGLAKFLLASGVPEWVAEGAALAEEIRRRDRQGRYRDELRALDVLRDGGGTGRSDANTQGNMP